MALVPSLRYAGPDVVFIHMPTVVRPDHPLGDPNDRRVFVIAPEAGSWHGSTRGSFVLLPSVTHIDDWAPPRLNGARRRAC